MTIADNKKAFFDYFIEERYEAGMALEGWEVKAIRANRAQIKEGYVVIRNAELFLIGAHISPLQSASTHVHPDPVRTRKLLLHAEEIKKLIGKVEQRGYTLVPLNLVLAAVLVAHEGHAARIVAALAGTPATPSPDSAPAAAGDTAAGAYARG